MNKSSSRPFTYPLKMLCILAHPDDESLGAGGILAKYAAEGVETYLITATRGQRGWQGPPDAYPGPELLGEIRQAELRAAADVLGVRELILLDYMDGELDQANPYTIISELAAYIRRIEPQVVVTFEPTGAYGHPDHIAISQFTSSAIVAAADQSYSAQGWRAHRVLKLYHLVVTAEEAEIYQSAFGDIVMPVDGTDRTAVAWPDWSVTTRINTTAYWRQVWQAVACHRSQLPGFEELRNLPEEMQQRLWGQQTFYRAYSMVNGGRTLETDLFEGIREGKQELVK